MQRCTSSATLYCLPSYVSQNQLTLRRHSLRYCVPRIMTNIFARRTHSWPLSARFVHVKHVSLYQIFCNSTRISSNTIGLLQCYQHGASSPVNAAISDRLCNPFHQQTLDHLFQILSSYHIIGNTSYISINHKSAAAHV